MGNKEQVIKQPTTQVDPAMRVVISRRASEEQAGSTNTLSRFETEVLTQEENEGVPR